MTGALGRKPVGSSRRRPLWERLMIERIGVRCPVCRSALPILLLWAVGETCPRCSRPLDVARHSPEQRDPGPAFDKPPPDAASATIVLADDHTVVRGGLRMLPEDAGFTIAAEAADTPHTAAQGACW